MNSDGKLFVVATPIGNMEDITLRALETLRKADYILCEDTRQTIKLCNRHGISGKKLISYHQHSKISKTEQIIRLLKEGNALALVSDAGTPGISDPGNSLIREVLKELGDDVSIVSIPGASAVIAALSVSGVADKEFFFAGFPPIKKGRNKFFAELVRIPGAKVLYESSHRILKTLDGIAKVFEKEHKVVVCREMTKMFETVYRGKVLEVKERIEKEGPKGEFVVIVN